MPGIDGYALAQKIRQECRDAPLLVALTGYGQKHDRDGRCRRDSVSISLNRSLRPSVVEVLNLMERNDAQAASEEDRLALSETAAVR